MAEKFNKKVYPSNGDKLHFNTITDQVELTKALRPPNEPDETIDKTIDERISETKATLQIDGMNGKTDKLGPYGSEKRIDELVELYRVGGLKLGLEIVPKMGELSEQPKRGVIKPSKLKQDVDKKIIEKLNGKINKERRDLRSENKLTKDNRRKDKRKKLDELNQLEMTPERGTTARPFVSSVGLTRRAAGNNASFALIKDRRHQSRLTMNRLKPIANNNLVGIRQPVGNNSAYCDAKFYFDCTLGNLSSNLSAGLSNANLITLTRQQTNRVQLSSELLVQDSFPSCIPINQKCDGVVNCPGTAADESELICGE